MRTPISIAMAMVFLGASMLSASAMPVAHADDPLGPIRAAVDGDRARTGCPHFTYSSALEAIAQAKVRLEAPAGGYNGNTQVFYGFGDPQAAAINQAYKQGAGDAISNCNYTEFGVGFLREDNLGADGFDSVTIVLGTPATAKPPMTTPISSPTLVPTPAVQQCPAGSPTPTVPAFGTCAPVPPPTDKVSVSFDRGFQWTVNVTSTADIQGKCTYAATNPVLPGSNKNFDIGPKGSASFTVLAPPPFSTYHVVVSCSGPFDGKNVEFGHVEQDVSA
jgi:hypothetical protein